VFGQTWIVFISNTYVTIRGVRLAFKYLALIIGSEVKPLFVHVTA
jgi:hypothetical protein